MSLIDEPRSTTPEATVNERINRRGQLEPVPTGPRGSTVVALLLACAVMIVLDLTSPVLSPLRRAVGEVVGPLQSASATMARPITSVPEWMRTQASLRAEVGTLKGENARLAQQVQSTDFDRNRLAAYDGLSSTAQNLGYAVVPAHVIGYGPAQSFERTITIDAGSRAGVTADMTVVAAEGLVGRVLRVTTTSATVLLIADADSVVGGRISSSMEVGFVHGDGSLTKDSKLDMELIDQSEVPAQGDSVVTWGSGKGAPYLSGIPIGVVDSVYTSLRDSTQRVRLTPYVDFSALDLVGIAVPSGTKSDRAVLDVDGKLR